MPRAPTKIKKRYVEGETEVCDFELEETLVYGLYRVFGPPSILKTRSDWQRAWDRWGSTILPKAIEHRPGLRPFALYAIGEIPPREPQIQLPENTCYWSVTVRMPKGKPVTHWLNVPEPWLEPEVRHLRRLGIVDDAEYKRHLAWVRTGKDTYPKEISLYV